MVHFQLSLFHDILAIIESSAFHKKYDLLFKSLDLLSIPDKNHDCGRTGYSRHAMLRAFIVKHLEQIKSVPRLIEFLDAHPVLTEMCGFGLGCLPDASQFYRFLSKTKHSLIEHVHHALNKKLIAQGVVDLDRLILDSKPVMAATRENNFKNPRRNSRNKHKKAKRNPAATLGYYSYQKIPGKKNNYMFFWGYRTHVIVSKEGVALVSITLENNQTDAKVAKKLIKKLKRVYGLKKGAIFLADAAYDEKDLYNFICDQLKCSAFIPLNPRNAQEKKTPGLHGRPLCDAGLEMKYAGLCKDPTRSRIKYRCALKTDRHIAENYPAGCPVNHSRFCNDKEYGCTKYIDVTDDARARVPRDSAFFKKTYKLRTEVERYFARLGDREAEQTTHYKMKVVRNQMIIAHLSLSLVACAAALVLDRPDKLRCYRTFHLPKPLRETG